MADNVVGTFATEDDTPADPAIAGLPVSTTGLLVQSQRGWVSRPIKITDYPKYYRVFGKREPLSYSSQSVKGLYDTLGRGDAQAIAGGCDVWIQRVVGSGGGSNTAASLAFSSNYGAVATYGTISVTAAFPLIVAPGDTFVVKLNGGGNVTLTVAATPATFTGAAATYAAVTANHFLSYTGPDGKTRSVVFAGTESTQALWLAALNTQLVACSAINVGGQIRLVTDQQGSGAAVSVLVGSSSDVLASLGFTAGAGTNAGANNVVNANVTGMTGAELAAMLEASAVGSGSTASGTTTDFSWSTDTSGGSPAGVQFVSGTGFAKAAFLNTTFHTGVAAGSAPVPLLGFLDVGPGVGGNDLSALVSSETLLIGGISSAVAAASGVTQFTLTLSAVANVKVGDTLQFFDNVGSATTVRGYVSNINNHVVTLQTGVTVTGGGFSTANTKVYRETWTLSVLYLGQVVRTESGLRMSPLSLKDYFVTRINNGTDEQQVLASDSGPPITADNRPANTLASGDYFTGGSAATLVDSDWIGSSTTSPKTGLYGYDDLTEIRRVAAPGVTGTNYAVSAGVLAYCSGRQDCRAVTDSEEGETDPQTIANSKATRLGSDSYGSMYAPWIKVYDDVTGQQAVMPPSAFILGMNARVNATRGIAKAPGGIDDGKIGPAKGVEWVVNDAASKILTGAGINKITVQPNGDVCVMLARTLHIAAVKGDEVEQIHARDTYIYLRTSIKAGTAGIYLESNTPDTRALNRKIVTAFLDDEYNKGTIVAREGFGSEDAYKVVCDSSNNPDHVVEAKEMITNVFVRIPRVVERNLTSIGPISNATA